MLQDNNSNGIKSVEFRAILQIIIKRKTMIISGLLAIVVFAAVVSFFILSPEYEAQVMLRVSHPFQLSENQKLDVQGLEGTVGILSSLPVMTMQTHVSQLQSEALAKRVVEKLQLSQTDLKGKNLFEFYTVEIIKDSNLIKLKTRHNNPNLARDIANTVSLEYIKLISEMSQVQMEESLVFLENQYALMQEKLAEAVIKWNFLQSRRVETLTSEERSAKTRLETEIDHLKRAMSILAEQTAETRIKGGIDFGQASILVVSAAETPVKPVKPNKLLNMVIAMLLGLVIFIPLAFIMELLDYRIKIPEDVERYLGLPVLGIIPDGKRNDSNDMINFDAMTVEAYRVAQANLCFSNVSGACKLILFTSAFEKAGKSTIVSNLAMALVQVGRKVLVVDCDLRKPAQHKMFGLDNSLGLTNYLVQNASLSECLQKKSESLQVVTSGPIPPNPMEMISCPQMKKFWTEQLQKYDYILVDAPPVLPVADALALVKQLDGAILVFDSNSTSVDAAKEAKTRLENVNGKIIGVFLNRVKIKKNEFTYGYYQ